MAHQSLIDAFDDCMNRIANGQTPEACLSLYPAYAAQLRPLLEVGIAVRQIRIPQAELIEDQRLVWEQIERQIPQQIPQPGRGSPTRLLLFAGAVLLLLGTTWVMLALSNMPPKDHNVNVPLVESIIPALTETPSPTHLLKSTITESPVTANSPTPNPTHTLTITPSITVSHSPAATFHATLTSTSTGTPTPTHTLTITHTPTITRTATLTETTTRTLTALPTNTPTSTFAPGCGAPLTEQDATNHVLEIYPNTTIRSVTQQSKFGGTLVWEVQTTHGIEVNIDIACGVILTIEQGGNDNDNATNDNHQENSNSSQTNNNDDHHNSNDNDDDNSGMGSDD